jgi:hypothetical protein
VTLAARFNKSRKPKTQPIPAETAATLAAYIRGRCPTAAMWGGTWAKGKRAAEMLRGDLAAAGIAYAVPGPDGPLYADFHALRHSFLTMLGRNGVDLRTVQILAGHSKPELTARYSHRRIDDLAGAVGKLPNLLTAAAPRIDVSRPNDLSESCPNLAGASYNTGHFGSVGISATTIDLIGIEVMKPLNFQGFGHTQTAPVSPSHERGRRDSNPQPPDRQSGTLTN